MRREAGTEDGTQSAVTYFASLKPSVKNIVQVAISSHLGAKLPVSINQIHLYGCCKPPWVTYATINNYAIKFFPNRQRGLGGRPMVVSAQTKRFIKLQVVQGQLKTARKVHDKLMELGYSISYKTAINVVKSMNFFSAIKVKKPLLTAKHMKRRLAWAKKYQNWTTDDWRRVVFSDETKVNIWGSDGCKYYWSRPGDPLKPHHIDVTVKHGGGSLMMWGCMTYEGPG
ncbi:hypothetical protein G6F33_012262 [Rhizopus arrhizus]|nr:hypothetical protein G6F33_012262 [Rhizopus arrhizus]